MTSLVNCSEDNILDNPKGEARPHHSVSYNPASNVLVKSSPAAKKKENQVFSLIMCFTNFIN